MRQAAMALNFDWRDSAECHDALYWKSTHAANRSRGSAEEAPSRSEQKWFDNARHALTTNANSDHALSAALASPHGLRQNDRC
jgi:hypothetical protein